MRGIGNVEKLKKYLVCLWVAAMIILVVIIGFRIVDADIILDQVRSTVLIQAKQAERAISHTQYERISRSFS